MTTLPRKNASRRNLRLVCFAVLLLLALPMLPVPWGGIRAVRAASVGDTTQADFTAGSGIDVNLTAVADSVRLASGFPYLWREPSNPRLVVGAGGTWDDAGVESPGAIFDVATYKMWYGGNDGATGRIGYATSADGLLWTKNGANPVVPVGGAGAWDVSEVNTPAVVKDGATYKMWFTGRNAGLSRIGYATSADGIAWVKNGGNPILPVGAGGSWEAASVRSPTVIKDGATYKMWYTGIPTAGLSAIGYATSADGIAWTKLGGNPVLTSGSGGAWDDNGILSAVVIKDGAMYHMYYNADDGTNWRMGYATSPDGIAWTKWGANPILDAGASGLWDDNRIARPAVTWDGTTARVWYTGYDGTTYAIGNAPSGFAPNGSFTSRVFDSGATASVWEKIWFNTTQPAGSDIQIRVRTGNTAVPDGSWSPWGPAASASGSVLAAPRLRYAQYNAELSTILRTASSELKDVGLDYHQNANGAATLVAPSSTVWLNTGTPTLEWSHNDADGDAQTAAELNVAPTPAFTSFLVNQSLSGNETSWTPATALQEGNLSWRVRTRDAFGAWGAYSATGTLKIDLTAPTNPTVSSAQVPGVWVNASGVTLNLLGASDGVSGVAGYSYVFDGTAATVPDTTQNLAHAAPVVVTSTTLPLGSDNWFHVRTRDAADNWAAAAVHYGPMRLDPNPPTSPGMSLRDGVAVRNSLAVPLNLTASDDFSGVANISTRVDAGVWSDWKAYATQMTVTLPVGEGARTIYAHVRDGAGNIGPLESLKVTIDTAGPVVTVFTPVGGNVTTQGSVTFSVEGTDDGTGVEDMAIKIGSADWADWVPSDSNITAALPTADGSYPVSLRMRDFAGNTGTESTVTILKDTTAPTIVSFQIEAGAPITDNDAVTLTVEATDAGAGLGDVRFKEGSGSWSKWSAFKADSDWDLDGGVGPREVDVEVRDKAGNVAGPVRATIRLGSITINPITEPDTANSMTITGTVTGGPRWDGVEVSIDKGAWQRATVDSSGKWSYRWDTSKFTKREHSIVARVRAGSDTLATEPVTKLAGTKVAEPDDPPPPGGPGISMTMIGGIVGLLVVLAIVGVLVAMRRKKKPEGPGGGPPLPSQSGGAAGDIGGAPPPPPSQYPSDPYAPGGGGGGYPPPPPPYDGGGYGGYQGGQAPPQDPYAQGGGGYNQAPAPGGYPGDGQYGSPPAGYPPAPAGYPPAPGQQGYPPPQQ